jgi:hypothetical protein
VLLVGFAAPDASATHQVCVEPEDGPVSAGRLQSVPLDGQRRYELSGDSRTYHSDRRHHEESHKRYRDRHRADQLEATLGSIPEGVGRAFFAGHSARMGNYDVHPVISVDRKELDRLPRLESRERHRIPMTQSLPLGIIKQILLGCAERTAKLGG